MKIIALMVVGIIGISYLAEYNFNLAMAIVILAVIYAIHDVYG